MFDSTDRDLALTLGEMERTARVRSNFDQNEARQRFREYLAHDSRFSSFDHGRLIDRVMEARSNSRTLDLNDPYLHAGGEKRPLDFSHR
jgi:hypothetical protein